MPMGKINHSRNDPSLLANTMLVPVECRWPASELMSSCSDLSRNNATTDEIYH